MNTESKDRHPRMTALLQRLLVDDLERHMAAQPAAAPAAPLRAAVNLPLRALHALAGTFAAFLAASRGPMPAALARGEEQGVGPQPGPDAPSWALTAFEPQGRSAKLGLVVLPEPPSALRVRVLACTRQAMERAHAARLPLELSSDDALLLHDGSCPADGRLGVCLPDGWRWQAHQATHLEQATDDEGAIWLVLAADHDPSTPGSPKAT